MKQFQLILCVAFAFCVLAAKRLEADVVTITSGSLSITYDGAAFANTANSNSGLDAADGDFMRFGKYWTPTETVGAGPNFLPRQPAAFRPLPFTTPTGNPRQPNFRDNRSELDTQFQLTSPVNVLGVNGNGPVANSDGRNRLSTNLTFDTNNVLGTVKGLVQTNGVSAWWFANDAIMDQGGSWVSWGDLSLRYDPSRVVLGYSGWVFANQLGGIGDIFDTKLISFSADATGITMAGDLYSSSGDSADTYNENPATWETYTLMKPDVKIGTFSFTGVTAVPEPGSMAAVGIASAIGAAVRWRKRRKKDDSNKV